MIYAHPGRPNTYTMVFPYFIRSAGSVLRTAEGWEFESQFRPSSTEYIMQLFFQIESNKYCEQIIWLCLHECNIISELRIIKLLVLLEMAAKWLKNTDDNKSHALFHGSSKEKKEIVKAIGSVIDHPEHNEHFTTEAREIIELIRCAEAFKRLCS